MTRIPEDVPPDVWAAAEEPAQVAFDASVDLYETGASAVDIRLVIARAILAERLAERERCGKIAEYGVKWTPPVANQAIIDESCQRIASSIRSQSLSDKE